MEEFIKMATSQLGIGEAETKSATGGILGMLKGQLGDGVFSQIAEKIPGAEALLGEAAEAEPAAEGSGGMLGGLMNAASSMLGGSAGSAAGIMGALSSAGLDAEKSGSFLTMFAGFIKDKVGEDLWGKIAELIPGVD